MSHHYTTKALGRAWAPSPTHSPRRVSSEGRFGPWPSNRNNNNNNNNTPRPRQQTQEPWHQSLRILRGRPLERLAVLLALLLFAAFLAYQWHRDAFHFRFVDSAAHHVWTWTQSIHRIRLGGSLLPTWARVDWREFAYVSYATSPDHVCNSVMLAESLHRLGARPETVILYAADLAVGLEGGGSDVASFSSSARLLQQAIDLYGVRVEPVQVLSGGGHSDKEGGETNTHDLTKLLAFNQTRYKRVLSLDSDATLLRPMDELLLMPAESPAAMPRAYWLQDTLCTSIMLASPSAAHFTAIQARVAERREGERDVDVVINTLCGKDGCVVIPHRPYLLLSGEMRQQEHGAYLGLEEEGGWNVRRAMAEAKYVSFSEPKPWVASSEDLKDEKERMPKCKEGAEGMQNCDDRDAWLGLVSPEIALRRMIFARNGIHGLVSRGRTRFPCLIISCRRTT